MSVIPEPGVQAAEQCVIVWNGRIEELVCDPPRTPVEAASAATSPKLSDRPTAHGDT